MLGCWAAHNTLPMSIKLSWTLGETILIWMAQQFPINSTFSIATSHRNNKKSKQVYRAPDPTCCGSCVQWERLGKLSAPCYICTYNWVHICVGDRHRYKVITSEKQYNSDHINIVYAHIDTDWYNKDSIIRYKTYPLWEATQYTEIDKNAGDIFRIFQFHELCTSTLQYLVPQTHPTVKWNIMSYLSDNYQGLTEVDADHRMEYIDSFDIY